ncbi:MAG: adenylate/guanylate cyclase domain-containing protein [Robiginitomaculum sp.]|nr:adenylate/guanylate cyclase domain-containing protein [Robiginitomaculum sp.]
MITDEQYDKIISTIRELDARGELFAAIDYAEENITKYNEAGLELPPKLRHLTILLMARSGSIHEATKRYKELKLDIETDIDSRTLQARLLKDTAFASPPELRHAALDAAGRAYERIYIDTQNSYPGINAATLANLNGNSKKAQRIVGDIIDTALSAAADNQDMGYWEHATLAEAYIILGDFNCAKTSIEQAATFKDTSLSDKASTLKQLRKLLEMKGQTFKILRPLRPKPTIHYTGHMIAAPGKNGRIVAENEAELNSRIITAIDKIKPGAGFGALASGSDILIAEHLLKIGADLHVVLPFDKDEFVDVSVSSAQGEGEATGKVSGETWTTRFHKCMERASSVTYLTNQSYMGDDILFDLGAKLAMGLSLLHSRHIAGASAQLAIWDKKQSSFPAGTAVDIKEWERLGHDQHIVDVSDLGRTHKKVAKAKIENPEKKQPLQSGVVAPDMNTEKSRANVAMLFGDFKGFSKLGDTELLGFANDTLSVIADIIGTDEAQTDFMNTWGDGIFAVWGTPQLAARSALALQSALTATHEHDPDTPLHLPIRISLHYGVTHRLYDPVLKKKNYFGEAVSRAARIEPITPVGAIYTTEAFAAMLMLDIDSDISAEYVGTVNVAKGYGAFPLYRIYRNYSA